MYHQYLTKNRFLEDQIKLPISVDLGISVVIPCHNEPDIIPSLIALTNCEYAGCEVEVIVVINASKMAEDNIRIRNNSTRDAIKAFSHNNEWLKIHVIVANELPTKHAGVGLARKIGMDEAIARFQKQGIDNGILACFDADATCSKNYLKEIKQYFEDHPTHPACHAQFSHATAGKDYDARIYEGIILYELYLRYYKQGLQKAGLPYAFHTVGSSMIVTASAYVKQGGMNRRKAGEDFYFLQKIFQLGPIGNLKTAFVYPSPRISDRVPFGTGKMIGDWVESNDVNYMTYHPRTFGDLEKLVKIVPLLYTSNMGIEALTSNLKDYVLDINIEGELKRLRSNSSTKQAFVKNFFNWFNAFQTLKYVHYIRDKSYGVITVVKAANLLLDLGDNLDPKNLLKHYRELDAK